MSGTRCPIARSRKARTSDCSPARSSALNAPADLASIASSTLRARGSSSTRCQSIARAARSFTQASCVSVMST